jgi:N-acetylmuramoyl-L-alanine amidase
VKQESMKKGMKKFGPRRLASGILTSGLLAVLLLGTSCAWLATPPGDDPPAENTVESASPQAQVMQTADATWLVPAKQVQPVAAPPSATDMQTRIATLENQVTELHRDMGTMIPALEKLSESQVQLQKLIAQLAGPAGLKPVSSSAMNGTPLNGTPMGAIAPPPTTNYAPPAQLPPGQLRPAPHDAPVQLAPHDTPVRLAPQAVSPQAGDEDLSAPPSDLMPSSAYPQQQSGDPVPGIAGNLYASNGYEQPEAPVEEEAVPQPEAASGSMINQVRFGEHPDKTRMVLDLSDKVAFSYNISPDGTIVALDMGGASWGAGQSAASSGSPLIASYVAQPDGKGGTQMNIQLRRPGKVVFAQYIPPSAEHSPRIVVDIAPL